MSRTKKCARRRGKRDKFGQLGTDPIESTSTAHLDLENDPTPHVDAGSAFPETEESVKTMKVRPSIHLPTELLRLIIKYAIPDKFCSTTFSHRTKALHSLSLASKRFHQIAQPLLYEIVQIKYSEPKGEERPPVFFNESTGPKQLTREANLFLPNTHAVSDFYDTLKRCPNLRNLNVWVRKQPEFDIRPLRELTTLRICGGGATLKLPSPCALHSLTSLTLSSQIIFNSYSILSPNVLPSLLYLSLETSDLQLHELAEVEQASPLSLLLPQLESINLHLKHFELYGNTSIFEPYLEKTLVDTSTDRIPRLDSLVVRIQHLRILRPDITKAKKSKYPITWVPVLERIPPVGKRTLRSLYLNTSLERVWKPVKTDESKDEDGQGGGGKPPGKFETVCHEKGIEVVFEEQAKDISIDPSVSKEFWRRMKEEKRERM